MKGSRYRTGFRSLWLGIQCRRNRSFPGTGGSTRVATGSRL